MTVFVEPLGDIAGLADNREVVFEISDPRANHAGTGTVTPRRVSVRPVAGVLTTPDLDPGPARVCIAFEWYAIVIPDAVGPQRLWPLIDGSIEFEPPVVSLVKQYRDETFEARDAAVAAAKSIEDVAADAAQVAKDRREVESAASAVEADRRTVTDARDVVVTANGDVDKIKRDVEQTKSSIENTANLVDQTLAQYGAQFVSDREASQKAVIDATTQAERAEDAADKIIAGAVLPGSVTRESLSVVLQQLVDLADTAVQPDELADAIAGIVDEAPGAMATLRALADALGNDPNFATTVLAMIGEKANADEVVKLVGAQSVNGAKDFIGGLRSNGKEIVVTDDARLSDSRAPKAHAHKVDDVEGLNDALQGIQQAFSGLLSNVVTDLEQKIGQKGTSNLTLGTTSSTAMRGDGIRTAASAPTSGEPNVLYCVPE